MIASDIILRAADYCKFEPLSGSDSVVLVWYNQATTAIDHEKFLDWAEDIALRSGGRITMTQEPGLIIVKANPMVGIIEGFETAEILRKISVYIANARIKTTQDI